MPVESHSPLEAFSRRNCLTIILDDSRQAAAMEAMAGTVVGEAQLSCGKKVMSRLERLNMPGSFGGALGSILPPLPEELQDFSRTF